MEERPATAPHPPSSPTSSARPSAARTRKATAPNSDVSLSEAGQCVPATAARFGMSERLVEKRLRLGHTAPEPLDDFRVDTIDLEVLKSVAVTTYRKRQMPVREQISAQRYRPSAWQEGASAALRRLPGRSPLRSR